MIEHTALFKLCIVNSFDIEVPIYKSNYSIGIQDVSVQEVVSDMTKCTVGLRLTPKSMRALAKALDEAADSFELQEDWRARLTMATQRAERGKQ